MQAVVYDAPRRFAVQEVPRPVAGAGEVVVDVTLAGVCGTDMHLHEGGFFATFPLTPGHESTGVVRQVGDGVDHVRVGQRVAVDNASACGQCTSCSQGNPLYCANFRSLGVNAPGGFAQSLVSPAHKVYPADDIAEDRVAWSPYDIFRRQLTIKGCHLLAGYRAEVIDTERW